MPLSPTGSSKSFKGPMDLDRSERERWAATPSTAGPSAVPVHPPPSSASTNASPSPSSTHRDNAAEEFMAITRIPQANMAADHHPTPWELYEKPTSPSPTSPSHAKLKVTFTSAPHDFPGVATTSAPSSIPRRTPPAAEASDPASSSSALHLTTLPAATAGGVTPSPVSPGSAGSNNGLQHSLHGPTSATTPPSAVRSPGSAGGFFSAFRPASPRIITTPAKDDHASTRREKERTASSGAEKFASDQPSPRMPREKGLETRSRRPSSVFDHVGSVLERFSKKVHHRAESREGIRVNQASSSSVLLPATEESAQSTSKDHIEYLASPSRHPGLQRNYSASSAISARSTDDFTVLSRRPALERTLIQVTEDNERFAVVDVSGLNSAAGIKERMLSKLHRFEEEPDSFSLFRTEIGLADSAGPEIGDDNLLSVCVQNGDDKGTLKFLLKQTSPAAHPSRAVPPPSTGGTRAFQEPPISPRAPALVLSPSETTSSFGATAANAATAAHNKSESLSSLSSISDALVQAESALAYDSGSEAGRKSILSRSKAVDRGARRSRGSNSADDNRVSLTSSTTSSRPTSALLAVHEQSSCGDTAIANNEGTWQSGETIRLPPDEQDAKDDQSVPPPPSPHLPGPSYTSNEADREIEELQNDDPNHLPQSKLMGKFSRRLSQRPATSSGALELEHTSAGSLSSGAGSRDENATRQRTASVTTPAESNGAQDSRRREGIAEIRRAGPEHDLPKSLQAGGREQKSFDPNDAARMYNQPDERHFQMTSDDVLDRAGSLGKANRLAPMRSMDELGSWQRKDGSAPEPPHARPQVVDPITLQVESRSDGRYPSMAIVRGEAPSPAPPSSGPPIAHLKPRQGSFDTAQQARPALTARPPPRSFYDGNAGTDHQRRNPTSANSAAAWEPMQRPQTAQPAPTSFGRPTTFPIATPAPPAFRPAQMRIVTSSDGYRPHAGSTPPMSHGGVVPPDPYGYPRPQTARPVTYANEFGIPVYQTAPNGAYTSYPQSLRPHTYHDPPNLYYRPPPPRPIEPPENPYTRAMFPASSSRQVSDFQRLGQAALSPGMTVQESFRQQQQHWQQQNHPHQSHQHFGPREPRLSQGASGHQQPQHTSSQQQPYLQHQMHPHLHAHPPNRDPRANAAQLSSQQHQAPFSPRGYETLAAQQHFTAIASQHPHNGHAYGHSSQAQNPPSSRPPMGPQQRSFVATSPPRPPSDAYAAQPTTRPKPPQQQASQSALPMSAQTGQHGQTPTARPGREGQGWSSGASTSDRSSGSSYVSSAGNSHRREHSSEDTYNRSSVEETHTAPTSARSSRSAPLSPDSSRRPDPPGASDGRRRGAASGGAGNEEIDVSKIRPLPKLPQPPRAAEDSPATTPSAPGQQPYSQPSEDEGTLKAAQWASLLAGADKGDTLKQSKLSQETALPSASHSAAACPSEASSSVTLKSPNAEEERRGLPDLRVPDNEGTFSSFGSFADDDDEDEGGTWAKPLDAPTAKEESIQIPQASEAEDDGSGTLRALPSLKDHAARTSSPRRPELRLTIDPSSSQSLSSSASAARAAPSSSRSTLHAAGGSSGDENTVTAGYQPHLSPALHRRSSFAHSAGDDWVLRPPPEQLYENLDEFFPKHDLDKPVLEAPGAPGSPMTASSPRNEGAGVGGSLQHSARPVSPSSAGSLARHKKSIRRVAEDRRRYMERNEPGAAMGQPALGMSLTSLKPSNATANVDRDNLARKRSTKLWGTKLLEMTPGQEQGGASSAVPLESPSATDANNSAGTARPVFKWVKGDLIGKGTYGRVYIALNATTGEMIAVKQVERPRTDSDREDSRQKGVVAALKSEIDTLKDLDHPNIVSYLGFEETAKFLHLFLEYVPGGSIASVLRKYGKLEETTIKFFVNQVLSGLSYLHERGVLHRDLKGDNLLVTLDGAVKISDFGTVRRSDDIYNNVEGMSLQGSVFWMAPEVVSLSKKGYSAKVDIWSLGCVVLEMFAGRRPWSDDEAIQAMFKIGKEGRAPPVPPDVRLSQEATHFLKCCFQLDPSCRPTASRLLEHVFPFVGDGWTFDSSRLYRTMRRSLQNRTSTSASGLGRS